jgi:hypothetical protein
MLKVWTLQRLGSAVRDFTNTLQLKILNFETCIRFLWALPGFEFLLFRQMYRIMVWSMQPPKLFLCASVGGQSPSWFVLHHSQQEKEISLTKLSTL